MVEDHRAQYDIRRLGPEELDRLIEMIKET
jgi:hypothetical protein